MDEESQHLERLLTDLRSDCAPRHATPLCLWRTAAAQSAGAELMIVSRGPGSGLSEFALTLELEHRMTNNRTFGVDRNGNKIPAALVEELFPSHL